MITIKKQQKIEELNLDGYKHIKNNEWELPDDLESYLKYHNFQLLGEGDLSRVYQSPTENFVVKVNKGRMEKEYSDFIQCSRNNKNDPHLPKFGKMKIIENDNVKFYVVFIEKLEIGSLGFNMNYACKFLSEAWMWIKGQANEFNSIEQSEELLNCLKKLDEKYSQGNQFKSKYSNQYLELIKTLFVMADYIKTDFLDIHPGNIGLRDDTIVILDPVRGTE